VDKDEASALLETKLEEYRAYPYERLKAMLDCQHTGELTGRSGTRYQFEIEAFWDSKQRENIRVMGSIDDMGWRVMSALSLDFIVAPDGSFVGE
jgi:hypothetical protein